MDKDEKIKMLEKQIGLLEQVVELMKLQQVVNPPTVVCIPQYPQVYPTYPENPWYSPTTWTSTKPLETETQTVYQS